MKRRVIFLRWALVLPVAVAGAVLSDFAVRELWNFGISELLPVTGTRLEPLAIRLLEAASVPAAFVLAGSQVAPSHALSVAVLLALIDLGLLAVNVGAHEFKEHWVLNTLAIVVAVLSAVGGVLAVREELWRSPHFIEGDEDD